MITLLTLSIVCLVAVVLIFVVLAIGSRWLPL